MDLRHIKLIRFLSVFRWPNIKFFSHEPNLRPGMVHEHSSRQYKCGKLFVIFSYWYLLVPSETVTLNFKTSV